jgi:Flp pilus assembly protein CpaB
MQIGNITVKPGQLYFGMAIIMALACGLVMNMGRSGKKPADKKTLVEQLVTTPVVVASYPVHAGDIIQPDQLQVVDWPVKHLPVGQTFQDLTSLVGKAVKADVYQGEPVFREKLAAADANGGLPVMIPQGLRAVTIAVSEVKGVAGFIKPGDKVDVLATFELKGKDDKDEQMTKTVLQNVLVIARAQDMQKNNLPTPEDYPELELKKKAAENTSKPDDKTDDEKKAAKKADEKEDDESKDKKKSKKDKAEDSPEKAEAAQIVASVTLAVTPSQAEKLTLAEDTGNLRLILRPDSDRETVAVSGIKQSQLIGSTSSAKPVAGKPVAIMRPRYRIEVIQGTEKGQVNF